MSEPAVLFILFNRPETTQKVFDAIRIAKPSRLYVAADAPRTGIGSDDEKCEAARAVTENIDWPCQVKRIYQDHNLGCSLGPRSAFDSFFTEEKEGVILEDDCVPHPDFFRFAQTMLERFRDNKRIISVNGSNLGYELTDGNSYSFSRFMNMWGWATWADRANTIDYSLTGWRAIEHPVWFLYRRLRQHPFDVDIGWYKYWQQKFDLTIESESATWWDWQWIWHQILHQQLSVVPAVNLVSNIGFHDEATHTRRPENPAADLPVMPLPQPYRHPRNIEIDKKYEEEFVKWVWCYHKRSSPTSYLKRLIAKSLHHS
jgi:hypothetical protein